MHARDAYGCRHGYLPTPRSWRHDRLRATAASMNDKIVMRTQHFQAVQISTRTLNIKIAFTSNKTNLPRFRSATFRWHVAAVRNRLCSGDVTNPAKRPAEVDLHKSRIHHQENALRTRRSTLQVGQVRAGD